MRLALEQAAARMRRRYARIKVKRVTAVKQRHCVCGVCIACKRREEIHRLSATIRQMQMRMRRDARELAGACDCAELGRQCGLCQPDEWWEQKYDAIVAREHATAVAIGAEIRPALDTYSKWIEARAPRWNYDVEFARHGRNGRL